MLAARFSDRAPVKRFFETLARQEQEHFELLALCRQLAGREGWLEEHFAPWRDAVPRLERQMDDLEESLDEDSLEQFREDFGFEISFDDFPDSSFIIGGNSGHAGFDAVDAGFG